MKKITLILASFLLLCLSLAAQPLLAKDDCTKAAKLSESANEQVSSNPAAAANKLREAIAYCGTSASLYYNLAMALYPQAKYDDAKIALEKAISLKPDYAKAMNALAFIHYKHGGDIGRAKYLAKKAVEIDPRNQQFADTLALLAGNVDMAPKTNLSRPEAIAIVIGNKSYTNNLIPPVKYALQDASLVKKYLVDTLGFSETNVILLKDASNLDLTKYFGNDKDHKGILYNRVRKDRSEVFIYYSGHGAPDTNTKKAYLIPTDADPAIIKLTGYSLDTLYENLAKLSKEKNPKSITVVMDACFSGAYNDGMLIDNASPIFIEATSPTLNIKNSSIFASSRGNQISSWYPEKGHSLFTYFFLKNIKSAVEEKRTLTAGDMEKALLGPDGVNDSAWRLFNREQEPQVFGDKNFVLLQ
jgi:hypothetical protein